MFEEYVKKYAITHGITEEEAKTHYLVIEYKKYCEELEKNAADV